MEEITIKDVQSAINEFKEAIKDKVTQKDLLDLSTKIIADVEKVTAKQETIDVLKTTLTTLQKQYDEMGLDIKRNGINKEQEKTFKELIKEAFKSEEITEYIKKGAVGTSAQIKLKDAADVTVADNFSGVVIPRDRRDNPLIYVDRKFHLRDYMATGTTNSNSIEYLRETAYTDGANMKTESQSAEQSDFTITLQNANVQTIDTFMNISSNMLNDAEWVSSYLSKRVPIKLLNKEDQQILFGNGTPPQLQGITPVAAAFSAGSHAGTITGAQRIDVLRVAYNQSIVGDYSPSLIIMNHNDLCQMDLIKDKNENYVRVEMYNTNKGQKMFLNIPVFATNAMTAGKFLIGDFQLGTQLIDRESITMYVTDSHASNFTKQMRTLLFTERVALPIYNTGAFIYGDFATAIAALDSGS